MTKEMTESVILINSLFNCYKLQCTDPFHPIELNGLKDLLAEAEDKRFPDTELVSSLREAIETAEKCTLVAQQLMSSKVRTRTRLQGEAKCRLTFEELQMFVVQLNQLPCKIAESQAVFGNKLILNLLSELSNLYIFSFFRSSKECD